MTTIPRIADADQPGGPDGGFQIEVDGYLLTITTNPIHGFAGSFVALGPDDDRPKGIAFHGIIEKPTEIASPRITKIESHDVEV